MTLEMIKKLNTIAQEDFNKAQAMLEGINMVLDSKFGWFRGRVAIFDNPNGTVAEKYANVHDAYAYYTNI